MIKLGLLGHNINYSLSGKIHEFAFSSFGVKGSYELINLEPADLAPFLGRAWDEGFVGLNVTTPYKGAVAELLNKQALGSVNTLLRRPGALTWDACSTDGIGFSRALARLGCVASQFKRVVILGSGGVLPSLFGCFESGIPIEILRRNPVRDRALSGFGRTLSFYDWDPRVLAERLAGAGKETLLIQASSAPSRGDDLSSFIGALDAFGGVFSDLVYRTPSQLYFAAREQGLVCQEGLPMLIEQARASQEFWLGRSIEFEPLWEFLAEYHTL